LTISTAAAANIYVCKRTAKARLLSASAPAAGNIPAGPVVEKDVLRVGTWYHKDEHGKPRPWTVTPATLTRIRDNIKLAHARGEDIPWQNGHFSNERIGVVEDAEIRGDTLYTKQRVTNRKYLSTYGSNPGDITEEKVSVGVADTWVDGQRRQYRDFCFHVANELNPIMSGQGPFVRVLSGRHRLKGRVYLMADNATTDTPVDSGSTSGSSSSYTTADDATVWEGKDVLAILAEQCGIEVDPEVDTFKEFRLAMKGFAKGMKGPETPAESEVGEPLNVEVPADATVMSHSRVTGSGKGSAPASGLETLVRRLSANVENLTKRFDANQKNEAKSSYHSEVDRLISANAITPADGANLKSEADKAGVYLMSHLGIVASRAKGGAVPVGGRGAKLLAANAGREDADNTTEERQKAAGERLMAAMGLRN